MSKLVWNRSDLYYNIFISFWRAILSILYDDSLKEGGASSSHWGNNWKFTMWLHKEKQIENPLVDQPAAIAIALRWTLLNENGAWCRLHLIKIKLRYRAFIQASFMLSHKLGRTICIFPITAPTREYYRAAPVGARARLCRAGGSKRGLCGSCPLIFWQYQKHKLFLFENFFPPLYFWTFRRHCCGAKGAQQVQVGK